MRSFKIIMMAALALGVVGAAQAELQNVELDGSIRIRGNYYDWDDNIFINGGEDQAWVEQRTRLGAKADFTDDVSLYIEFDAYNNWGDAFRSNFISGLDFANGGNNDNVDLYQAYIEVNNAWGLPLRTRIGRQELEFGSEWLLGNNDTARFFPGLSFDGIRTTYATDMFSVDLLSFKLSETFNDFADGDVNLYGIYGSYLGLEDWQFDLYWLWLTEDEAVRNTGAPVTNATLAALGVPGTLAKDTDIHTIGLRGAGTFGAFDLEAEVAYQFGEIDRQDPFWFGNNDLDYDAFAFNIEAGYTFDMAWTPRVYLGGAFFEGADQDRGFWDFLFGNTNNDLSFNRLFSNWEYSEFIENTELSNAWVLRAGISAMPTEKISLLLAASYFETDESNDAGGFLWWRNPQDDTLGWEIGLYGDYQYSEDLVFRAGYAHFFGDEDGLNGNNNSALNGFAALVHNTGRRGGFLGLFGNRKDDADYNYLFWEAELSF